MTLLPITDVDSRPVDAGGRAELLGLGAPLLDAPDTPVHFQVATIAARQPRQVAVESAGRTLSYAELDAWADRIAAQLQAAGLGRGARIGILVDPSVAMVAAVLGVLRSGAAYLPLDPSHPDARITDLLTDAGAAAVVSTSEQAIRIVAPAIPVFDAGPADSEPSGGDRPQFRPVRVGAEDPAYVIYTSGSTGEPKGVQVLHGQLAASTLARRQVYPGPPTFLLVSPLAFDSSVAGLWNALTTGGRLVVATSVEVRDPDLLLDLIARHQVDRLLCVPSLYAVLLSAVQRRGTDSVRSLDTVIVAGETLPPALVARHIAVRGPASVLVNEYGPTETTVWASYHRVCGPGGSGTGRTRIPIGRPVPGVRLYVLDRHGRPAPLGAEGELVIGGHLVADGYLGRPEATAQVFVGDPFIGTPGARMYRTGDIVRWNETGTLDFVGRRDHQIKIRGHRVELGAIEAALRDVPAVQDAVVTTDPTGTGLVGFVVASADLDAGWVRSRLAERLPPVMLPGRITMVDRFPLTVTGKVDRAALAACVPEPRPVGFARPAADTAVGVITAWAEVLNLTNVPAGVNFFDLGGNSLTMFQLQDALERHTGSRPSTVALFRHTTVAAQVSLIRDGGSEPDETRAEMRAAAARRASANRARLRRVAVRSDVAPTTPWLRSEVTRPSATGRLICFPHAGGSAAFFRHWGHQLPNLWVHAVCYPGRAERLQEAPQMDLLQLATDIAEAVALVADRPLILFGHSLGAVVALETARALFARGLPVAHLFASGSSDAAVPEWPASRDHEDDGEAIQHLLRLGGTDPELASDPDFQALVLPYLRADGRMYRAYAHRAEPALQCPVTTIVGDADHDADRRPWSTLTANFEERTMAGDHFYLLTDPPFTLLNAAAEALAQA
jgi:amino acid adenylation domain-containing protein